MGKMTEMRHEFGLDVQFFFSARLSYSPRNGKVSRLNRIKIHKVNIPLTEPSKRKKHLPTYQNH